MQKTRPGFRSQFIDLVDTGRLSLSQCPMYDAAISPNQDLNLPNHGTRLWQSHGVNRTSIKLGLTKEACLIRAEKMSFGVVRRRIASGGSNLYLRAIRPSISAGRVRTVAEKEVVTFSDVFVSLCTLSGGGPVSSPQSLRNLGTSISKRRPNICGDLLDVVVPPLAESITDGTLAKFLKNPGDRVELDEAIAQIETDKVTIDVTSPGAGVIQKFVAKEGDTVEPGTKVAVISKSGEGVTHVAPSEKAPEQAASPAAPAEKVEKPKVETPTSVKPKAPSPPPPKRSATEPQLPPKDRERRVPMTRLRKRVATRLKDSQNTFAMLTTFNEVDMMLLFEKHGVKLGLMSGFIKAAVSGLQNQPIINAVIDGDDIIYRDYVDISIAVGTPKGLVVPVIRNADKMNFADIEKEINTLAKKANDGTISIDEMAGVCNLGMPLIVPRPVVVGGNVVSRPMMYIALTYDHRLIDGREAVFFLRRIKDVVEDPRRLLLDI
ncbi:Dihydrolipoyllysine-residue succinyltransferase component of 2-oxoglutarate dehydrogenase complex 2, partial [Cucurbita argyrosperma subsp. sororia]